MYKVPLCCKSFIFKFPDAAVKKKLHIFCDIIDNYGDIGFSLRLARSLCQDFDTVLYCTKPEVMKKITDSQDAVLSSLKTRGWPDAAENYQCPDVIIEAFSCRLPQSILPAVRKKAPLIIASEYLTAEKFAEECHGRQSFSDGTFSYFFFPGFTRKTGGLIFDESLLELRKRGRLLRTVESNRKKTQYITIFLYKNSAIDTLLAVLQKSSRSFRIKIFEGLPLEEFNQKFKTELRIGEHLKINNLEIEALSMISQARYDILLAQADLNLVRGEESAARAMLLGKPFLWHIYPQSADAHLKKLEAFFEVMRETAEDKEIIDVIAGINLSYNHYGTALADFDFDRYYDRWRLACRHWSSYLISLGSFSDNLKRFINDKLKDA